MEPAPRPGVVRKPDGPFPFPKGQPAFRNETPASMRPGFWLGRAPRAIVPWRGRELKRDGPIRRRADRRGIRRARERLSSHPGRRDGRAPPNFATARAWRAVSPGRRCPRRSNSIPTLVAGSVPPRAPAAPGFEFLDHHGNIARAGFVPRPRTKESLRGHATLCGELRCLCAIRGRHCCSRLQERRSIGIGCAAVLRLRLFGEARPQLGHLEQDSLLVRQRIARHPPAFFRKFPICFRFTHYPQLRLAIRCSLSRYADTIPGHQ